MSHYNHRALRYDCIEPHETRQATYLTPAGRLWIPYLLIATVVVGLLMGWGMADQIAQVAP